MFNAQINHVAKIQTSMMQDALRPQTSLTLRQTNVFNATAVSQRVHVDGITVREAYRRMYRALRVAEYIKMSGSVVSTDSCSGGVYEASVQAAAQYIATPRVATMIGLARDARNGNFKDKTIYEFYLDRLPTGPTPKRIVSL